MIGTIICIAHRGGGEGVFENRRETIKKTLQNKLIDAIEIDLRCTKDGVLVAHHDRGVYINGDRVWIDKVEFASMKHLGIPRFEEILLLTEASGKILNIDVKDENCIDPLVQFFKKKPSKQKIYFDCFNLDVLLRLEEELDNGEYYLSLTLKDSRDLNRRFFVRMIALLGSIFFSRIILFLLRRRVKKVKVDGINLHHKFAKKQFVADLQEFGFKVFVWGTNDKRALSRLIAAGVDGIKVSEPYVLQKLV